MDFGKVASLVKYHTILTKFPGIDFDSNGAREFVIRDFSTYSDVTTLRVFEKTADNSYSSVFTLPIDVGSFSSYYPTDVGDSDGDRKQELLTYGRTANDFFVRIYEAAQINGYPDTKVWQTQTGWWTVDAYFADLDNDGKKEVVFGGQDYNNAHKIQVFENTGDNAYAKVNVVYTGDLDKDGRKEFAVGGMKTTATIGEPRYNVFFIYEATSDNTFQKIKTISYSADMFSDNAIAAADLNGDGDNELILASENPYNVDLVAVWDAVGDNQHSEVWKHVWTRPETVAQWLQTIGVGDHDSDGKPELIFSEYNGSVSTSVYERMP